MTREPVPVVRSLLDGAVDDVAPRLLGLLIASRGVVGRIVEVEAYDERDPASHSARGRTRSNATMFGRPGLLYVYLSHGLHHCTNIVTGDEGSGEAVLVRALDVIDGQGAALARRGDRGERDPRVLAGGPGRVGAVLGLSRDHDGSDLIEGGPAGPRLLDDGTRPTDVDRGPRVGVRSAPDRERRWWLPTSPAVSRYRRHPRAEDPSPS